MRSAMRILFVCTGNICRSPMAKGVMRKLVADRGLADRVVIDSAGTGGWQVGEPPDPRAVAAAAARGYALDGVARQVAAADFRDFDLIVAMDHYNVRWLRDRAPDREARLKIRLLLGDADVPDPYSGPASAFDRALDLIVGGCRELLDELLDELSGEPGEGAS
jgi:protein-tyrosine phosphatase